MLRLNQFGILSYIHGSKKNGNDPLLFFVVVRYFYRKEKNIALTFLMDTHLQIPQISVIDSVMKKNKFSLQTVLPFLLQKRKSIKVMAKIQWLLLAKECFKSLHTNQYVPTAAHLQSLPDLKNNGCKSQDFKTSVVGT